MTTRQSANSDVAVCGPAGAFQLVKGATGLKAVSAVAAFALALNVGLNPVWAQTFDHAKICDAIKRGMSIRLFYRPGEPERIVEPRFLYYTRNGDVILNGQQIAGYSESGNVPGSRSFRLDRAQRFEFTEQFATSPAGSGRLPSGAHEIICRYISSEH